MMDNRAALVDKIKDAVVHLETSPLYEYRQANGYKPVIGEGNLQANIMFIGEAPGAYEAKSGRPFVGASGRMLNELFESIGIQRSDVYITNVVKDRPPDNRDPSVEEVRLYTPFLAEQLQIIQPRVIATLGRFAMDFIFMHFNMAEQGQKISQLHGKVLSAQAPFGTVAVVPLYHPAVALYSQDQRETLHNDFQVLKQFVSS